MIPALSRAISAAVLPRIAVCSREIGVITATSGGPITFVASKVPPRPTSTTCQSTRGTCARTSQKNSATRAPNVLTSPWTPPRSASIASRIASSPAANSRGETGSPPILIRSVNEWRCGLVNSPVESPACRSTPAIIAETLPFPLEPVTCTVARPCCGSFNRPSSDRIVSRFITGLGDAW